MQWKQSQGDQWKVFSHMSALAWCCKLCTSAFCHMAEQVKQIHADSARVALHASMYGDPISVPT